MTFLPYFQVHVFTRAPKGEQSGAHTYVDGVNLHKVNFDLDPDLVNECNNMCNAFTWYFSRKNIIN